MPSLFDLERVDLAALTQMLRSTFGPSVEGSVVGRTLLRDEVVRRLGCSELQAETLVDTLVDRGFVVRRESRERGVWLSLER